MAGHTQKKVFEALMFEQCTVGDLKDLTESIQFAKSLLGDSCDTEYERMLPVHYKETCDMDKAMMCLNSVNISWMVDCREKLGKQYICR